MTSGSPRVFPARLCLALGVLAGLAHLFVILQPRGGGLLDGHSFRQLQTALSAQQLLQHGFKFAYETPVLGPPWSIPMEFPLYGAAVAALAKITGLSLEHAGALVSLASLYAALAAVWLTLRRLGVSRTARFLFAALALSSPVILTYARHFLIETTAVCFGAWFIYAVLRSVLDHDRWWIASAVLGTLAALAKVTTFLPFGLVAVGLVLGTLPRATHRLRRLGLAALTGAIILATSIAWVRFTDDLKAQNPLAAFLTSANLREFNFGTLAQRCSLDFWIGIYRHVAQGATAEATLFIALPLLAFAESRERRIAVAALATFATPVLVFANLYFVHDYYFLANVLFLGVTLALGLEALVSRPGLPPFATAGLVALAIAAQLSTTARVYGVNFTSPAPQPPVVADVLAATTDREDVVLAFGYDWTSAVPYYSGRRAIMLPRNYEHRRELIERSLALLPPARIGALVLARDFRDRDLLAQQYAERLGLSRLPTATTSEAKIYLRTDLALDARRRLGTRHWPDVTFADYDASKDAAAGQQGDDLTREFWRGKLAMCHPAPFRLRSKFEMNAADLGGPVLGLHAPSELLFTLPLGAARIRAAVGLVPAAYANPEHTDGVTFELWLEPGNGTAPRLLTRRQIDPFNAPADRGDIELQIDCTAQPGDTLVLRISPGPQGDNRYDWTYLRSLRIE